MSFLKNNLFLIAAFASLLLTVTACKDDDPSILKVYVRSSDQILTQGATVRIVADISKGTPEFFEEKKTDESGVVNFNLDELFGQYSKSDDKVAYFNLYAKDTTDFYTLSKAKAKAHITSTATIVLKN